MYKVLKKFQIQRYHSGNKIGGIRRALQKQKEGDLMKLFLFIDDFVSHSFKCNGLTPDAGGRIEGMYATFLCRLVEKNPMHGCKFDGNMKYEEKYRR